MVKRMQIRELEYILAIERTLNFGEAARQCGIAQPTLSTQLKKFEAQIGVALFERSNKKVLVTTAGKKIIPKLQQIYNQLNDVQQFAVNFQQNDSGLFTLGVITTVAPYLLPKLIPNLVQKYPNLEIRIIEGQTDTLLKQLEEAKLDAIIIADHVNNHLQQTTLIDEPFFVAVNTLHPLAQTEKIKLKELEQHELILLEEGHCLRNQVIDVCKRIGIHPLQHHQATNLETIRHLIHANLGITLMPLMACIKDPNIRYVPISEKAHRSIELVWRKKYYRQDLLNNFFQFIDH